MVFVACSPDVAPTALTAVFCVGYKDFAPTELMPIFSVVGMQRAQGRLKTGANPSTGNQNLGRAESRRRYALARPCYSACHALR